MFPLLKSPIAFHRDIVIPKSRAVQEQRDRAETSEDLDKDDVFYDAEDDADDEDQDESKWVITCE